MRAIAQHVGSRNQKSIRAQLKKMDAEQAALEAQQQQSAGLQALDGPGLSAAAPHQVSRTALQCMTLTVLKRCLLACPLASLGLQICLAMYDADSLELSE